MFHVFDLQERQWQEECKKGGWDVSHKFMRYTAQTQSVGLKLDLGFKSVRCNHCTL